jgi:hypothetical protein
MANQINIQVGADIKNFQTGISQAVQTMKDAGQDMSAVSESVGRLTQNSFKSISQAYRQTSRDAETLALHLGTDSEAFKQAAGMAQVYGQQLQEVRAKIAGVDMSNTTNQVQKATSGFNGLGNSINQLTREMPAFTYSVQTGFMALSNNIPMFVDQIKSLKDENLRLAASGAPVQSVFGQVTSALFSWNTALSLGITALTVFSPQIIELINNMGGVDASIKAATEAQKELNKWVQDYIETDYQKAIRKENEETAVKLQQLRELVRLQSLSVEQSLVPGQSRFDVVMEREKTMKLLEAAEKEHKRRLAEIDEKYNKDKSANDLKQAQFEVSIFEDKFTKMRTALEQFKNEDSFKAAKDLTLPIFDPETINAIAPELESATQNLIQPFVHMRAGITEQLDESTENIKKWAQVAAGVMSQAGAMLGAALATGDFDKAGEAIVRQLGGIAIQIGAAMIAIGIPMALGEPFFGGKSLKLIAGGTALTLAGGMMQATGTANKGGGGSGGGGGYQSNYTPFSPSMGGNQNFSFDGVVRGSNLEIVLINTNNQNRRIR